MKTESTAAEKRMREKRLKGEGIVSFIDRLITDADQLKEELASVRLAGRAAASALYRTETQRDEVVEKLELITKITGAENVEKMLASLSTGTPEESS